MITRPLYIKFRENSKDPIQLCYLIYNHETKIKIPDYKKFCMFFAKWLSITRQGGLLTGSQKFKNRFDKLYRIK